MSSGDHRHGISKTTQCRDLKQKKKEIVYLKCTKAIYTHTHTNPHTLSIVKVNGSIHTNILKAT